MKRCYNVIGKNVFINSGCRFQDQGGITIGKNVWIGSSTTILPNVTIGDNAIIGAGSVVTKDIPADMVAVGNPARVIKSVNERKRGI